MIEIDGQKEILRKKAKEKVAMLPEEYCTRADEQIFRYAVSLPEYQDAETIFCYVGTKREINTMLIMQDAWKSGKKLGVPKCIAKGIMEVYEIKCPDDLQNGAYGILEPKKGCTCIEPEEIDLAFVPCVTCSKDGRRLGYGGGFYDRYLEWADFPKAALCRSAIMEDVIPTDVHDLRMDMVISEEGIFRVHRSERCIHRRH